MCPLLLVSTGVWEVFGALQNVLGEDLLWQYKFSCSLLKGQLVSLSKGTRTC